MSVFRAWSWGYGLGLYGVFCGCVFGVLGQVQHCRHGRCCSYVREGIQYFRSTGMFDGWQLAPRMFSRNIFTNVVYGVLVSWSYRILSILRCFTRTIATGHDCAFLRLACCAGLTSCEISMYTCMCSYVPRKSILPENPHTCAASLFR